MAPLACGHVNEYMHVYDLSMWLVDHGIEHAPCVVRNDGAPRMCARAVESRARPQTANMPQSDTVRSEPLAGRAQRAEI